MSAAEDLLQDHIFIRRLQAIIEKSYELLHESKDVPFKDLIKITDNMEQFVEQYHHNKEEGEFGRRIAEGQNPH